MSSSQTTQLATIFVSAVESSRDGGRPISFGHETPQTHESHTCRPRVIQSLRPTAPNTLQER
jgi:hypothetical protein